MVQGTKNGSLLDDGDGWFMAQRLAFVG